MRVRARLEVGFDHVAKGKARMLAALAGLSERGTQRGWRRMGAGAASSESGLNELL